MPIYEVTSPDGRTLEIDGPAPPSEAVLAQIFAKMPKQDDSAFRQWYGEKAKQYDLNPNPDDPAQFYDYRAAFAANASPDASGHWPSQFKKPGHPNMVVGGFNVQTGERVPGTPQASEAELVRLGWDPETAKKLSQSQRTWTDTAVDALPTVGGLVGGIAGAVGGPLGAIGGAALGGAAGEGYKQIANRLRGKDAPTSPVDAVTSMAAQGAMQGGAEAIGGAVTKGATKAASAVYRGYLKPSLSKQMLPRANEIVNTALDEAIPISRSGIQTAERVINEIKGEVDEILKSTPGHIDLHAVAEKVRRFAKARYYTAGADMTNFNAAMKVADNIDAHPSIMRPGPKVAQEVQSTILDPSGKPVTRIDMVPGPKVADTKASLTAANKVKGTLDTEIGEASFGVESGASKTTKKYGRHAMRVALEKQAAKIAPLNARESKLIDAAKTIARAVEREANQQKLYGAKTIAAGMAGSGLYASGQTDSTTAAATAFALRAGLHPAVASRAAIVSRRLAKELGVGAMTAARLAIFALSGEADQHQQAE